MSAQAELQGRSESAFGLWFAAVLALVAVAVLALVVLAGPKNATQPAAPAKPVPALTNQNPGNAPARVGNQSGQQIRIVNGHPCWECTS